MFTMSPENPFILGVKAHRSRLRVKMTVPARVFALLWVVASSYRCCHRLYCWRPWSWSAWYYRLSYGCRLVQPVKWIYGRRLAWTETAFSALYLAYISYQCYAAEGNDRSGSRPTFDAASELNCDQSREKRNVSCVSISAALCVRCSFLANVLRYVRYMLWAVRLSSVCL